MEWFGLFGVVKTWVSDCVSHFKNELINTMGRMFGVNHHFVTPHCPWANGTVERDAPAPHGVAYGVTASPIGPEQQPSDRLGGIAPTTAFTGLPATPPLSGLVHPEEARETTIDWVKTETTCHITGLAEALCTMHKT
ncbi:hypothetical protein AaE_005489, partial [Aphanomyces astaci]